MIKMLKTKKGLNKNMGHGFRKWKENVGGEKPLTG